MKDLTERIIGAAIEVHKALGPGLLESSYEECLCHELRLRGVPLERQVALPIEYKGVKLDCGYRLDLLVAKSVVVELKAVERIEPIHEAQLLTYLKLGGWTVGLLINFNVPILKNGIKRIVNNYKENSAPSASLRWIWRDYADTNRSRRFDCNGQDLCAARYHLDTSGDRSDP